MSSREIHCPACGQDALLLTEPVFEGFTKTGEKLSCASCGHVFESGDEVPFVHRSQPRIFTEKDISRTPKIFDEHEADRICRHCINYTVNPFMQWCGLHRREVEATDSCSQFERKPEQDTQNSLLAEH